MLVADHPVGDEARRRRLSLVADEIPAAAVSYRADDQRGDQTDDIQVNETSPVATMPAVRPGACCPDQ
jgi:hypothetical protein